MNNTDILNEFMHADAILKGHFVLSSGLHSDTYLQCARVLMTPSRGERLCNALAQKVRASFPHSIDIVVAPAMGGVIVGYELARQLGVDSLFCERVDGRFTLRRGFHIPKGANVLMVEDVVTTGKSSLEAMDCVRENGGNIIGEACLIDRSGGSADLGIPLISLLSLSIKTYTEAELPPELERIPVQKPGSRWIK